MVFPRLQQDGTFTIRLDFSSRASVDRNNVDAWLASWLEANDPWERNWRGAGGEIVQVERLHFRDSFLENPKCVSATTSTVTIELTGRASSAYWKDWMVRMIEGAVSELGLIFARAVDADTPLPEPE